MAARPQKLNFEKICRVCLQIKKDMRPLFEQLTATMLMGISKVQVAVGDGLPTQLCLQCVHQLSRSHAFKEQVERNDIVLREQAKLMAEEALKAEEDSKALLNCDTSQFMQFIEVPVLNSNTTTSQLLENFFAPVEQETQPIMEDKTESKEVLTKQKEEGLNEDEESYLQMVVLQATTSVAPGRHMCNLCHKEFKHSRWLKLHMRSHTNWIRANCKKPPMCPICERTFKGPGMLKLHMRTHEQRPPKQPTCSICQRTFPTKTLLYRHRQTHFEKKIHQCVFCEKRFCSGYALRSHMARHRGERPYICSICNKSFYNPTDLKVHFRLHTGEKPLKCSECNKTFRRHSTLCQHMKKHRGIRNHICNVCNKGFYEVSKLNAHMRVHTGERPFECSQCPRKFAQQSALIYHRRTHTGEKPYTCKLCSARFTTSSARNNHLLTHAGHKNRFTCPVCYKACSTRAELRSHSSKHSGERLYGCERCAARFASAAALSVHRRHHDAGRHTCHLCGKGYTELSSFKKHMKIHANAKTDTESSNSENNSENHSRNQLALPKSEDQEPDVKAVTDINLDLTETQGDDSAEQVHEDNQSQGQNQEGGGTQKKFKCGICVKSYMYLHSLKKHLLSHVQMCVFSPDGSERLYGFRQQPQQEQLQQQQQQQQQQHQQQQQQVQQVQLQQQHVQQLQQQVLQVGGVQQLAVPIHTQQLHQGIVQQGGQHSYPVISSVQSLQLQQTHQHINTQPQQLQVQTIQIHPQQQPIQIHAVGVQQVQQEQLVATSSCQTMLPNILQLQPGAVAVGGLAQQELGGVAARIILQPQHHAHHPQLYTIHH